MRGKPLGIDRRACAIVLAFGVSACESCRQKPAPPLVVDASDDARDGSLAEQNEGPLPVLDANKVADVYAALGSGSSAKAASLLGAMTARCRSLAPSTLEDASFGGDLVLVPTRASCSFGDVGIETCHAAIDGLGGSCDGGKLVTKCGQILVDARDGSVKAFYKAASARLEGGYVLGFERSGSTVVRRPSLEELMVVPGEIVAAVGAQLVSFQSSSASTQVRLVDPSSQTVSPPCVIPFKLSRATKLRLLGARRLLLSDGAPYPKVGLCDGGRALSFSTEGGTTVLVDRDEKRLFVSGLRVPPSAPVAPSKPALFDHVAIDLSTGNSQRVRTKETVEDVPNRDMLLVNDEKTLIVATDRQIAFFATSPLRAISAVDLGPTMAAPDSSYNATPALELLPDGKTLLAMLPITVHSAAGTQQAFDVWILSLATKTITHRGTSVSGARLDPSSNRVALVVATSSPRTERIVMVADESGVTTRVLAAGEGDDAMQALPSELATTKPRPSAPTERTFRSSLAARPDPAVVSRLTSELRMASGLIIPKSACPEIR